LPTKDEKKPDTPVVKPSAKPPEASSELLIEVTEEYHATDEEGKPIGTPTKVIGRGKTELEAERDLREKLKAVHIAAVRKMTEWKKKFRSYDESKPSPTFEPIQLDAAERLRLNRELNDPEKMEAALDQLLQARLGVSPEEYRKKLKDEVFNASIARGARETQAFLDEHPEFPIGAEARQEMEGAFSAKSKERETVGEAPLEWTSHNLELIFEELVETGRIAPVPPTRQETVAATPAEAKAPGNTGDTGTVTRPRGERHSSMTPGHTSVPSGAGSQPSSDDEFLAEVRRMSTPALRLKIKQDPKFRQRLDSIKR
jgi:hypothetical protein